WLRALFAGGGRLQSPPPLVRFATMSPPRRLVPALLLAGLPLGAAARPPVVGPGAGARAGGPPRAERPQRNAQEAGAAELRASRRSLSEAVRFVQRSTGGQILGAELVPYEGRNITRVKYMDDRGRVRYMEDPGPGERGRRASRRDDHETR